MKSSGIYVPGEAYLLSYSKTISGAGEEGRWHVLPHHLLGCGEHLVWGGWLGGGGPASLSGQVQFSLPSFVLRRANAAPTSAPHLLLANLNASLLQLRNVEIKKGNEGRREEK